MDVLPGATFVTTWLGRSLCWDRPDEGVCFVAASLGTIVVLFVLNRVARRCT